MVTQEVELPLPPTALLAACVREPHVFLLDGGNTASWETGEALLGFSPRAVLRISAVGEASISTQDGRQSWSGDPFHLLERFHDAFAPAATVAALSYELRHWIERLPGRADSLNLPVLHAGAYDWVLAYDYATRTYQLRCRAESSVDADAIITKLRGRCSQASARASANPSVAVESSFTKTEYLGALRRILDYIGAGDVYQVNLAQRFVTAAWPDAPLALCKAFAAEDPMPFAAYLACGEFTLVSNSPECLLAKYADRITTFPIKGTRRRGSTEREDEALRRSLFEDEKEQAEHIMIVDLERNDLGKICRAGTVAVEELAKVATFPKLHHMISRISGNVRGNVSLAAILRALFPGGSITGAPKIRSMEIIDELETVARGFYTGSVGIIDANGDARFNIAIRTATVADGRIFYHAGGGVVADSDPDTEYAETLLKAASFFSALGAHFHE